MAEHQGAAARHVGGDFVPQGGVEAMVVGQDQDPVGGEIRIAVNQVELVAELQTARDLSRNTISEQRDAAAA